MGIYTYRVMHGKQTLMKTPDTPALARDLLANHASVSGVKWSKAQKASRYAKQAMADPQVRVAVSDFLAGKNLLKEQ